VGPALSPVEQSGFAAELIAALSDAAEVTIDRIAHEVIFASPRQPKDTDRRTIRCGDRHRAD
jgi:hypothetical protein